TMRRSLSLPTVLLALVTPASAGPDSADVARDVQPILQRACAVCHNDAVVQGGLSLASRAGALKGGVSGPAIVPGDGAKSLLIKRLGAVPGLQRMPMGLPALKDADVAALRAWIDAGAPWPDAPATLATASGPDFVKEIQPIFQARCTRCHGADLQRNSLRLDSRTGALRGGLSGAVIVPGKSDASLMIRRLLGKITPRMPFEGPPLPEAEIARIRAWIDAGALGPAETVATEKKHWAYVKPERAPAPTVRNEAWVRNPIDRFVLARLEKESLAPAPEADPATLIRRVSLDLVGLPPAPAEVDAFLADASPDAYEKVVERLLASPHYGERWARPWLDLARYADTNGYEKDRRRTAWKYRDWVIGSLNADMPFRQFTIEQFAGDMLPSSTVDQQIATGFHRNTLLNQEGGIDVEEARWETLVDRVNTTASVWMGSTLACAQCHNHKFDPFSQRDYYRMLAFFNNADYQVHGLGPVTTDKWIDEPELELPTPEQAVKRDAIEAEIARRQARLDTPTPELTAAQAAWERDRRAPAPAWTVLKPSRATAENGTTLTVAADGSVLASGERPDRDTYTLVARTRLAGITAVRLEALADPPDPVGRADAGTFFLTRFRLAVRPPQGKAT
ncbi:MAG TPA: DUF1549 domain-containing protein, partial [Vicinamibacteria bacterium]